MTLGEFRDKTRSMPDNLEMVSIYDCGWGCADIDEIEVKSDKLLLKEM